jgi:uncharacterized protein (DUF4415 family)
MEQQPPLAHLRTLTAPPAEAPKRRQGERGKQRAPTKRLVTMRLSASVLEHFKATGPGWQTRIDETLQRAVKRRPTFRASTR